jgi:hypothetical protein
MAEDCWPAPEVSKNVNKAVLVNLRLTDKEEKAPIAFMKTFSDEFESVGPKQCGGDLDEDGVVDGEDIIEFSKDEKEVSKTICRRIWQN